MSLRVVFNPKPPQHVRRPVALNMSHSTAIGMTADAYEPSTSLRPPDSRKPRNTKPTSRSPYETTRDALGTRQACQVLPGPSRGHA